MTPHQIRWSGFIEAHSDPRQLQFDQKAFMFRHIWRHPDITIDEHQKAIYDWQCEVLKQPRMPAKTSKTQPGASK